MVWITLFFSWVLSGFSFHYHGALADSLNVGINYGMVADNLPSPAVVVQLLQSISVTKVKIYSTNATVLRVFGNTGISFIVGIGNEDVAGLTDSEKASKWVQNNILLYLPNTKISAIAVGNEVYSGNDTQLMSNLLPAMKNIHYSLSSVGLDDQIKISTPHSLAILSTSYPPSSGMFSNELVTSYIKPLLSFLSQTGSPFMINAYPYFAYKASPSTVSLDYVLFSANMGVADKGTGLIYYNMLDAQVDAIYAAMAKLGYQDVKVIVSETGWPSRGDMDEAGATGQYAQAYNANLIRRLAANQGTPLRPSLPLEAYIFALFNEDAKPGPTSERNYGLFKPDGTKAYNFGLDYPISSTLYYVSAGSRLMVSPLVPCLLAILCVWFILSGHPEQNCTLKFTHKWPS